MDNPATKNSLAIASALARRGFVIPSVEVCTPDKRTWVIESVPAGRGRLPTGAWGPVPGSLGGYRLFEVDRDQYTIDEHDAVDGDLWDAGDLMDYLRAVGEPKTNRPRGTQA